MFSLAFLGFSLDLKLFVVVCMVLKCLLKLLLVVCLSFFVVF